MKKAPSPAKDIAAFSFWGGFEAGIYLVFSLQAARDRRAGLCQHLCAEAHEPLHGMLQRARDKLVLQGDWGHDQLIFIARFEFFHRVLHRMEPRGVALDSPTFPTVSTVCLDPVHQSEVVVSPR
jgi:hypothetical protein